jgi:uncharacterized protein
MTNFIPIFPLSIVVYPGEDLNLHIFEPRYKELINDCVKNKKMFGIPSVIKDRVNEMGTLMEIAEVTKIYDDGKMDIKTKGIKVFRILEVIKTVPERLYSGAIVNYPHNEKKGNKAFMENVLKAIRELHNALKVSKDFKKPDEEICSYDVAHHAGLTLEEEYEFLQLMHELQRTEYLKQHILKVLPLVAGMESLKERIKMNGHFKDLKGFDI